MYLLEAIEVLKQLADNEGNPYVISDGATDWDPYNLMEAIMEASMDYDYRYAVDICGDSFAIFDIRKDGYLDNIPRYKVMWV